MTADVERIAKSLQSWHRNRRAEGALRLRSLGPQSLNLLLMLLKREKQKYEKVLWIARLGLVVFLPLTVVDRLFLSGIGLNTLWGLTCSSVSVALIATYGLLYFRRQRLVNLVDTSLCFNDPQLIGTYIQALHNNWSESRSALISLLVRLLPSLESNDAVPLDDVQIVSLYSLVLTYAHPESDQFALPLANALLYTISRIGDQQAIPYVEKIVNCNGKTTELEQFKELVRDCLTVLHKRTEQKYYSETLLRPVPMPSEETLLRPARDTEPTNTSLLLRPSTPPEEERE